MFLLIETPEGARMLINTRYVREIFPDPHNGGATSIIEREPKRDDNGELIGSEYIAAEIPFEDLARLLTAGVGGLNLPEYLTRAVRKETGIIPVPESVSLDNLADPRVTGQHIRPMELSDVVSPEDLPPYAVEAVTIIGGQEIPATVANIDAGDTIATGQLVELPEFDTCAECDRPGLCKKLGACDHVQGAGQ